MTQELILDICGVLGVLFHSLAKLESLLKDARIANIDFDWKKDYLKKDAVAITLSFLSVVIWHLVFAEVAASYPGLSAFTRLSFVVMGSIGSWVFQYAFGSAKKSIRKVIDMKTNIADGKENDTV